jgi:hypothetical protein
MKLANVYRDMGKLDSAKFYYQKTIDHYNTIKPRDLRMMAGYYWLGTILAKEKNTIQPQPFTKPIYKSCNRLTYT